MEDVLLYIYIYIYVTDVRDVSHSCVISCQEGLQSLQRKSKVCFGSSKSENQIQRNSDLPLASPSNGNFTVARRTKGLNQNQFHCIHFSCSIMFMMSVMFNNVNNANNIHNKNTTSKTFCQHIIF